MLIGQDERRPPWLVDPAADLLSHSGPGSDCLAARSQLPSWAPTGVLLVLKQADSEQIQQIRRQTG